MSRYQRQNYGPNATKHLRTLRVLDNETYQRSQRGAFEEADELSYIATKLDGCCRSPFIAINKETSEIRIHEFRCKLRICSYCGRCRAEQLKAKMLPLVEKMNSPRMIGFSLKSNDAPLRKQFERLVESFAKLRRSKLWIRHFTKGFYTLEATHNSKSNQWHPHIHGIVDGDFIQHAKLKALWESITGDSNIVFIRLCHSHTAAVNYMTKYVTKTQDASTVPEHRLAEWAITLKGMRFLNLFGKLRHDTINEEDERKKMDIHIYTPMSMLSKAISEGDDKAKSIWDEIIYHDKRGIPKLGDPSDETQERNRRDLIERLEAWLLPPPEPEPEQTTINPENTALFDNSPAPTVF